MKRKLFLIAGALSVILLAGCGKSDEQSDETTTKSSQAESVQETTAATSSAVSMREQGNPKTVKLSDIAEEGDTVKAWIKISTQFDSELSMYDFNSLAPDTHAIAVTFKVSNMSEEQAEIYWCYQLTAGGKTTEVWDNSSPTDKLTVKEDGTYMLVFDADKALGGAIESIGSFQFVYPCSGMDTSTVIEVTDVKCITDTSELDNYVTGAVK